MLVLSRLRRQCFFPTTTCAGSSLRYVANQNHTSACAIANLARVRSTNFMYSCCTGVRFCGILLARGFSFHCPVLCLCLNRVHCNTIHRCNTLLPTVFLEQALPIRFNLPSIDSFRMVVNNMGLILEVFKVMSVWSK